MKIEITDTLPPKTPEMRFPVLMKSVQYGSVVMFSDDTVGTCLTNPSARPDEEVGRCDTDWKSCFNASYWTPFTGTVTLSND